MRATVAAFAMGLTLTGIVMGCGGEATIAPIGKAQFIKRADAICGNERDHFQTLYEQYLKSRGSVRAYTLAEKAEIVQKALVPAIDRELGEIRALGSPHGDAARVAAILGAIEYGLERVEDDPSVEASTEAEFKRAHVLAQAYGLDVCGP